MFSCSTTYLCHIVQKLKKKFENQCLKSSNIHDILREYIVWTFHEIFLSTKDQMQEINAVWTTTNVCKSDGSGVLPGFFREIEISLFFFWKFREIDFTEKLETRITRLITKMYWSIFLVIDKQQNAVDETRHSLRFPIISFFKLAF